MQIKGKNTNVKTNAGKTAGCGVELDFIKTIKVYSLFYYKLYNMSVIFQQTGNKMFISPD